MARTGVLKHAVRVDPSADQVESAGVVAEAMESGADAVILTFSDGRQVALPSSLAEVLRASAREVADGHASLGFSMTVRSPPSVSPAAVTGGFGSPTCWSSRNAATVGERVGDESPRQSPTLACRTDPCGGSTSTPASCSRSL